LPRDKLYTNSSFVVAFLNPCFSPLYLKVYSDTKSIFIVKLSPIKLEQIWPKKYVSEICWCDNSGPEFLHSGTDFSHVPGWKNSVNSDPRQHHSVPKLAISRNLNFSNFESLSHSQCLFNLHSYLSKPIRTKYDINT